MSLDGTPHLDGLELLLRGSAGFGAGLWGWKWWGQWKTLVSHVIPLRLIDNLINA